MSNTTDPKPEQPTLTASAPVALLACPFCGRNDASVRKDRIGVSVLVECQSCHARGPATYVHEEDVATRIASEGWNMRQQANDGTQRPGSQDAEYANPDAQPGSLK